MNRSDINIIIGCECSGAIRQRFRDMGYNAISCDTKPAEDGSEHHIVGDVRMVIKTPPNGAAMWDMFICHPPCTKLSVSGNHVYAEGKPRHAERLEALGWTDALWFCGKQYSRHMAFENPVGVLGHTSMGKATQYVQPYMLGDDASKNTGFWLHNLPKLVIDPSLRCPGRWVPQIRKGVTVMVERWDNQTDSGQNKLGPSPERATERSRTYPGIANAIVSQWSKFL